MPQGGSGQEVSLIGSGESSGVKLGPGIGNPQSRSQIYWNDFLREGITIAHQLEKQSPVAKICSKASEQCKNQENGGTKGENNQQLTVTWFRVIFF